MFYLTPILLLASTANAQFFNFFGNQQQQQQQQQQQPSVNFESSFLNNGCNRYLCPDTQACVNKPMDCPCPFPSSQLKCVLPDNSNFVCISKPATSDEKLNGLYDDPVKGPKAAVEGMRDCGWVNKAYNGLV
ncbi:CYFA0S05e05622g1_1 [Cyberlindnera fabianii]|uniref:Long chronological lifespan protein 2 n=1 Tax=Cyberlindnera fabianii TaxID=36022 RepID=A0A061AUP0_CYBFA|nr:Long chronological lifespan protein 2 [Cyberlindnera fabianii]CDR40893.1 CYFA0S05e05622g1_1 [Cyberlindnera fabianii]